MNDAAVAAFLALVPEDRRERTLDALATLCAAEVNGSIFNQDFITIKRTIDYSVDGGWDKFIGAPFWHGKGGHLDNDTEINNALQEIVYSCNPSSARETLSAAKKLAKWTKTYKITHPMVQAMIAFVSAVRPVAEALEAVKGTIVKGRKPNPEAQARKAAKLENAMPRATCGCCFKTQAVLPNGKVHDHGYTLPRAWAKSASCYGRDFRPLEVSDEGPRFMVSLCAKHISNLNERIANFPSLTKLTKHSYSGKATVVTPADAEWTRTYDFQLAQLKSELAATKGDLANLKKVVAEWKAA